MFLTKEKVVKKRNHLKRKMFQTSFKTQSFSSDQLTLSEDWQLESWEICQQHTHTQVMSDKEQTLWKEMEINWMVTV